MHKRPISHFLLLAFASALAIAPFFRWGSPSGHDFEFHAYSWMEVLSQWKQGILYPRWAALAHWGYGEARFLFYPPGSWTLGAGLGAILPWKVVPGAYCWLVLTLAGAIMYALARRWLRPADALFAAVLYAVNPYHLLIVYWRSAYAELLAAVIVPLALLGLLRLREEGGARPVLWLGLTFAGAWIANTPSAVMIHYSAALLAMLIALREKSPREALRFLCKTGAAILLGAGLAAFYLVPAVYEQPWVNIAALLSPGVRPQDNFLFTNIADVDHNRFNLLVSLVALSEIAAFAFAAWVSLRVLRRLLRSKHDRPGSDAGAFDRNGWFLLAAWGAACALAMLPVSNLLWEHLPKFRFVQLPFRWLLCLNAPLALLLTAATMRLRSGLAVRSWIPRVVSCTLLLAMLLWAGHRIQPPWWDQAADIQEMGDAIDDGTGYEGTDEYVPAGDDPYELNKDLPQISDAGGAAIKVQMLAWTATEKHFTLQSSTARDLTMRLFNYPAWRVTVNGRSVMTQSSDVTGLMIVPVMAGASDVEIRFSRTPDRLAGDIVSLLSAAIFAFAFFATRGTPQPPNYSEEAA